MAVKVKLDLSRLKEEFVFDLESEDIYSQKDLYTEFGISTIVEEIMTMIKVKEVIYFDNEKEI